MMKNGWIAGMMLGATLMNSAAEEPSKEDLIKLFNSSQPQAKQLVLVETPSKVDFPGFVGMSKEVMEYRKTRMVNLEKFNQMSKEPNTIILDTRSKWAFDAFHIKGAVHMNFSDFTQTKLDKLIPDKSTRILIYCNNNFDSNKPAIEGKSIELALNIPTFINLYGYGFKNLYELSETVKLTDKRLEFVAK